MTYKAMNLMNYTAIGLRKSEFAFGIDFLEQMKSELTFPLVTSNLIYKENQQPFGERYALKKIGPVTVGILSVIPSDILDETTHQTVKEKLEVQPAVKLLKGLLPEVRKHADVVVLLSQYGPETTKLLLKNFKDIDVAICGDPTKKDSPRTDPGANVFQVYDRDINLGSLHITLDDSGKIIKTEDRWIGLDDEIASNKQINKLIDDVYIARHIRAKSLRAEKERRELEKEIEELQKLSPSEYIQNLQNKEATGGTDR